MSTVRVTPECKHLIKLAAKKLNGAEHRAFIAEAAEILCLGSPRLTETEFSFGRQTVELGMHEKRTGLICYGNYASQGKPRTEEAEPKLEQDIRSLVDPENQADPQFRNTFSYTRITASAVRHIDELVVYADNGPENNSHRTQFLLRIVEFAKKTGLRVHLVYYPPYHSKYNPIERGWSYLERHWNGGLLTNVASVLRWTKTMVWKCMSPIVKLLDRQYAKGVRLSKAEPAAILPYIIRHSELKKWDVTVCPEPVIC